MYETHANPLSYRYSRLEAFGLLVIHAIALLILYFVPVFICPTYVDRYNSIGLSETPLFFRAHLISDFLPAYTQPLLVVVGLYLFLVYRRARAGSRWLSAASNLFLLSVAMFGMVYAAYLVNPLIFFVPKPPAAMDSAPDIESAVAIVAEQQDSGNRSHSAFTSF